MWHPKPCHGNADQVPGALDSGSARQHGFPRGGHHAAWLADSDLGDRESSVPGAMQRAGPRYARPAGLLGHHRAADEFHSCRHSDPSRMCTRCRAERFFGQGPAGSRGDRDGHSLPSGVGHRVDPELCAGQRGPKLPSAQPADGGAPLFGPWAVDRSSPDADRPTGAARRGRKSWSNSGQREESDLRCQAARHPATAVVQALLGNQSQLWTGWSQLDREHRWLCHRSPGWIINRGVPQWRGTLDRLSGKVLRP